MPPVSAAAGFDPEASRSPARDAETEASTASPSDPPTCRLVFTRPDASPESRGDESDIAIVTTDGNVRPAPSPNSNRAGRMLTRYVAVAGITLSRSSPPAMRPSPGTSTERGPYLVIRDALVPS